MGGLDDIAAQWQLDAAFEPDPDRSAADAAYEQWQRAVGRARAGSVTGEVARCR